MWIKMLQTYSGPCGLYAAGQKFDLPEAAIEKLPKTVVVGKKRRKLYEVTCAPWDEKKDEKAIRKAERAAQLKFAQSTVQRLTIKADELDVTVNQLKQAVDTYEAQHKDTLSAAKQSKSEEADRDCSRGDLKVKRAVANLDYYVAERALVLMDLEDAKEKEKEITDEPAKIESAEKTKAKKTK